MPTNIPHLWGRLMNTIVVAPAAKARASTPDPKRAVESMFETTQAATAIATGRASAWPRSDRKG